MEYDNAHEYSAFYVKYKQQQKLTEEWRNNNKTSLTSGTLYLIYETIELLLYTLWS